MHLSMEEEKMRTTTKCSRLIATVFVLALGAFTFGVSVGIAAPHEPKAGLGYPSEAAADAIRGVRNVEITDPAHMALIQNARRHGLAVRNVKPMGSRAVSHGSTVTTTSKVTGTADGRGGFSWTYPGVLAGLVLAFALVAGGIVLVARRLRSRAVTV
jgi:hypothetical protein